MIRINLLPVRAAKKREFGRQQIFLFGLILVLFILFEPLGIYGRWLKIRLFFSTFPMYKAATFKRQKSYMRSERLR